MEPLQNVLNFARNFPQNPKHFTTATAPCFGQFFTICLSQFLPRPPCFDHPCFCVFPCSIRQPLADQHSFYGNISFETKQQESLGVLYNVSRSEKHPMAFFNMYVLPLVSKSTNSDFIFGYFSLYNIFNWSLWCMAEILVWPWRKVAEGIVVLVWYSWHPIHPIQVFDQTVPFNKARPVNFLFLPFSRGFCWMLVVMRIEVREVGWIML